MFSKSNAAPGLVKLALEGRAPWEHAAYFASWPLLKIAPNLVPRGDGHAVLVLPGFVAGDNSTYLLRQFLNQRGYSAHGWLQGRNLGPKPAILEATQARVVELHEITGRKVSIVGWSLGGIYAREIAKLVPDSVRQVISLGSPFGGPGEATNAWWLYKIFNPDHSGVEQQRANLSEAPPVPTTAIFSRTDGVVAWQGAVHSQEHLDQRRDIENIEVEASHVGMGANPLALMVIADRLAQPEGNWKPFERVGWKALAFRDPARPPFVF